MAFYDITKEGVLRAADLFKYRLKGESSLSSKGGTKDFSPDGSWMQAKTIEASIQEKITVIGEPRVEKLKSLVEGVWDPVKNLINVDKPGKFWAHMGFVDNRRNWLYPEEALFLMETNTLEVYHQGLPLSVQEAYSLFLTRESNDETGVSLNEYQVFCHLRRLGFVVLRHEEGSVITDYEKRINLTISKKDKKERMKELKNKKRKEGENGEHQRGTDSKAATQHTGLLSSHSKGAECVGSASSVTGENFVDTANQGAINTAHQKDSPESSAETHCLLEDPNKIKDESNSVLESADLSCKDSEGKNSVTQSHKVRERLKRERCEDDDDVKSPKKLHTSTLQENTEISEVESQNGKDARSNCRLFYNNAWENYFQQKQSPSDCAPNQTEPIKPDEPVCDSSHQISFPDMHKRDMLILKRPDAKLVPKNVEIGDGFDDALLFDVEDYRLKNPLRYKSKREELEEERDTVIRGLDFSFAEWTRRKPNVQASDWPEYKKKVQTHMQNVASTTPVDHLWQGKITPLVRPEEAWSHAAILEKLSIVKSADDTDLIPDPAPSSGCKISFDVHLPDSRFRKSMPGIPNHRVCVMHCSAPPPGLAEIQHLWARFKDGVPLHWAVVDSGEIAFYVFDNSQTVELLP